MLALLASPSALPGYFWTYSASLTNAQTFYRPESLTTVSTKSVHYQAQKIWIEASSYGFPCRFGAMAEAPGLLYLYSNSFNPNAPLSNLVAIGTTVGGNLVWEAEIENISVFTGETWILVTTGADDYPDNDGAIWNTVRCPSGIVQLGNCPLYFASPNRRYQTCLLDRFAVKVDNVSNSNRGGLGYPVQARTTDSSLFSFYGDVNWELLVKVLDACSVNGHFWVFSAAATDQRYTLSILDGQTGAVKQYSNPLGTRSAARADAEAFDCP